VLKKQNPTAGDGRACEIILAGALDGSQPTKSLHDLQTENLKNRFALTSHVAAVIAGLCFAEAER
jgi:hypothetical protein